MPTVQEIATIRIGQRSAEELAAALKEACVSLGFLYLTETGLEHEAEELFSISKTFFRKESPEEKSKYTRAVRCHLAVLQPKANRAGPRPTTKAMWRRETRNSIRRIPAPETSRSESRSRLTKGE